MKKFKITKGNRVYIVDAKSHIDAISKVKAVKTDGVRDSISQWKPGMSEIGLFQISYKKGTVNQSILVKAATKEDAINKFTKHKLDAKVIGVNEYPNPHFGEPILDSAIKDEWSGVRSNGVIFNYSNGKYTITHKNGKVETFPGNKFNTAEELFKYIDNIKDSVIKDEDYSKYLSIVKQLEKLVEPANRALQQKIAKYGVTKQDIRNNSPKYRDVCREIPELKVWAKLIMQLPGELAGFMPAHPSQESVDKLKKAVTNSKAFDSTIK